MNILDFFKRKETCSPVLSEFDITPIKDFAIDGWTLGETHGISHWQRVERNGILLSMDNGHLRNGVKINVVRAFAYLHDKWRLDDGEDIDHGMRASENLIQLRETLFQWLTDDEFEQLYMACKLHTVCHSTGNPTIDTCFDADRLDIMRVGITPDPERMATERGKFYATNIEQFYADTKTNEEDLPF